MRTSMRHRAVGVSAVVLMGSVGLAEPLATVGGRPIERSAVEQVVASELAEIENQRYEALREGVDALIAENLMTLEAEARGVSVPELAAVEIFAKVGEPSDEEIRALYDQNKQNLEGQSLELVRSRLVDYLKQVKLATRQEELMAELKKKYPTVISLRPPTADVEVGTRVRGPGNAPVTIIEFSDYECPFCKRAEASVKKVLETYGDRVRLSYRDYPLEFHADARPASLAAHCANAQGKFWEYHEKLMASDSLSSDALERMADEVGLDREKFDPCLANQEYAGAVDADVAAGEKAGVNGTPAFFINGRLLDGAQPFEAFQEVIEEELAWAKQQG